MSAGYRKYLRLRRHFDNAAQEYAFRGSFEPAMGQLAVEEYREAKRELDEHVRSMAHALGQQRAREQRR